MEGYFVAVNLAETRTTESIVHSAIIS